MKEKKNGGKVLAEAAQTFLKDHSTEKFSLEKLANTLFVNKCYLVRVFVRETGMTPLSYHHQLRCASAKDLLSHTDLSISKVGETVGFVSSSHFSYIFRKSEGCTPSEYRKLHASRSPDQPVADTGR